MSEHTYQDRLAYMVSKVKGTVHAAGLPRVAVVAYATDQAQVDALMASYLRQTLAEKRLFVVVPQGARVSLPNDTSGVHIIAAAQAGLFVCGDLFESFPWMAAMVPEDYYGPNYLVDLVLATRYSNARAIGKHAYYLWSRSTGLRLIADDERYSYVSGLEVRSALVATDLVMTLPVNEWVASLHVRVVEPQAGAQCALAVDEFNYCRNGGHVGFTADLVDAVVESGSADTGWPMSVLARSAELVAPAVQVADGSPVWLGSALAALLPTPKDTRVSLAVDGDALLVESTLGDATHEYLYSTREHTLEELGFLDEIRFFLDTALGLNLQLVVLFLDANKQRLGHVVKAANRNHVAPVPVGTQYVRLGLRVYGSGAAAVHGLVLGHRPLLPPSVVGRAGHLVLTNHYPSYSDLYRNGFVHSRVRSYARLGVKADVFRLRPEEGLSFHEFEGVDITTGSTEVLSQLLGSGQYQTVMVHFLDRAMWEAIQPHAANVQVRVWIHGAEIQAWHRRAFNYTTDDERAHAKARSDERLAFWRNVLQAMPANMHLIFVSRYLADLVMEDLGFQLPVDQYSVIHNPINTDMFVYARKAPELRTKILSIRPYASATYANDLSVKALLELSTRPWFRQLEFRMVGDGPLFEETLRPLREFDNVIIDQRFLTQNEIAALHKEYGVFLCPSRMDTQGVSRDEAMSSGLVPVTNAVAAIPEFADEACAMLAPAEDHMQLAAGIERLFLQPELFVAMSSAAAERVRRQSAHGRIIDLELATFLQAPAA